MAIGSVVNMPALGRMGVVTGATAVGETADGRTVMSVRAQARVPTEEAGAQGVPTVSTVSEVAAGSLASSSCSDCDSETDKRVEQLEAAERADLEKLRIRDAQVRQEERAHAAAAGANAGAISYTYQVGPDGRPYVVSGSVPVSYSNPSGDPAELKEAASRISAAANAAVNPSAADLSMAREGYRVAAAAQQQGRTLDIVG